MQSIDSLRDLERYGFNVLTGEACGLVYRVLCDVYPKGLRALQRLFDFEIKLNPNWNSTLKDGEAPVGSIMLPYELVRPLGVFCLIGAGCRVILLPQPKTGDERAKRHSFHAVIGFTEEELGEVDDYRRTLDAFGWCARVLKPAGTAAEYGRPDRNVHAMSGRVS